MDRTTQIFLGGWMSDTLSVFTRGWWGGVVTPIPPVPPSPPISQTVIWTKGRYKKRRIEEDDFVVLLLLEGEDY